MLKFISIQNTILCIHCNIIDNTVKFFQKKHLHFFGRCNTIVIGNFGGQDNAFLIQNMFPIIEKYVDHEHTIGGLSVNIHSSLSRTIISNAMQVLSLCRQGHKLVFPDIEHIYDLMENELQSQISSNNIL